MVILEMMRERERVMGRGRGRGLVVMVDGRYKVRCE